jgi:pimeloyl-ACP methyl ester carboxylesterase
MAIDLSETPDLSQRRSISFYAVLLLLVAPLYCSVPFAWVFVIYVLHTGNIWSFSYPSLTLFIVAFAEVIFSVYHFHLAQQLSGPSNIGAGNVPEIQLAFHRILKTGLASLPPNGYDEETLDQERPGSPAEVIVQLEHDDPRAIDFRNALRTWFGRQPWSKIRLHEVRQWVYWSIFNKELPELEALPQSHKSVLDDTLELLERRIGKRIPEGSDATSKAMLLNIDKPNILWRPFTFYALIATVNFCLDWWYQKHCGFFRGNYDGLEYLVRIPKTWVPSRDPRPVVFLHGLGLGLFQYHTFLLHLSQEFSDRPLLIVLQPHISQSIFHPKYLDPMPRKQTTKTLASLFVSLGWADLEPNTSNTRALKDKEIELDHALDVKKSGVTLLSHSNGTFVHAWLLKDYPHIVTRSCFVDPVTFSCWEGDVCRNFFYKTCTTGTELLVRYFVGTEMGVVNLLQKRFDWSSNSLWYEEIPNARDPSKTLFLLGDKDSIISPERVKLYLRSHGIRKGLWCDPNGRHGQALLAGGEGCKVVYDWLKEREY